MSGTQESFWAPHQRFLDRSGKTQVDGSARPGVARPLGANNAQVTNGGSCVDSIDWSQSRWQGRVVEQDRHDRLVMLNSVLTLSLHPRRARCMRAPHDPDRKRFVDKCLEVIKLETTRFPAISCTFRFGCNSLLVLAFDV